MEFIENFSKEEYENFVKNHPTKSHFMQSYEWGEVMKYKNFSPYYVGLKENGKLVATALLLKKRLLKDYCYFYCPRGFILNYDNFNIIKEFTKYLKRFSKKQKALFIKIDPDLKLHNLDIEGNVIGEYNRINLIENMEKLGYKHLGFNKNFTGEQPRFTFRLNLNKDFEMIYKNMHPTTRKILNKGNQYNLNVYIGNQDDIPNFYETMLETGKREGLVTTPISYYQHFYEILNKNNMSDLYVIKVKLLDLINTYQENIEKTKLEYEKLEKTEYKNEKKKQNLLNDLNKKIIKDQDEIENIKKIDLEEITLSSIMTVKYNDKVWTIHGGNHSLLRELNANYLLYYQIIEDAHKNGYQLIDFFGTSGEANPDKKNPIYGIHSFKKRLGGEYTEFIGEMDLIIHPILYNCYKYLLPFYRKIKR